MRSALALMCAAGLGLAACGGSSHPTWSQLRAVRITVAQPGLPPPYGAPKSTTFTTPAQLTRVTSALNAHHIAKASTTTPNPGCAGGFQIAIVIVPQHAGTVRLGAYRCANQDSGDIGGDLPGFLSAVGVSF